MERENEPTLNIEGGGQRMGKKCKDCLHCTFDGLYLIARKWTLIDVEHDCPAFMRRAMSA